MFKCAKNKLWLENPLNLVCDSSVVPLEGMTYSEQMNAITRLTILIFLVLFLIGFKDSFFFLILSLLFIIILYYLQSAQMKRTTETYKSLIPDDVTPNYHDYPVPKLTRTGWKNPAETFWCNDGYNLDSLSPPLAKDLIPRNPNFTNKGVINNKQYISRNQKLVGGANPKTRIAPVIVPPAADFDYWKANNLSVRSIINDQTQIDNYQSGYQVMTCCPPELNNYAFPIDTRENIKHKFAQYQVLSNIEEGYKKPTKHNYIEEGYKKPLTRIEVPTGNLKCNKEGVEFDYPYLIAEKGSTVILPGGEGQVNAGCGYNPEQFFSSNLPANLPSGNAQRDPRMKQYNKNTFTQIIQPGVYTRNEVNEPINSNMGISFTQQFEPLTSSTDPVTGDIMYTEHDPRIIDTDIFTKQLPRVEIEPTESNIYDPRFSGYGTSYRSYTDDNLGQTRFYYDDVNAIRMPNYIVRSDIDREQFADKYGPIPEGDEFGNSNNPIIRGLANNAFLDNALEFRTDLQERLMRKHNARAWQQRQMPIRTGGQRMGGGMNRIF